MRERREKILWVAEDDLLSAVGALYARTDYVRVPEFAGLPGGVEVISVHHSWDRRAFGVLLRHDSFPLVPVGEEAPPAGPAEVVAHAVSCAALLAAARAEVSEVV